MIKLSDYVFKYIASLNVNHVFVLSGGGCMHLVDSLGRNKKITYVSCLHEQGAVIAAGAYAQYTNHLGTALVTTGPGGTNALTGVAAAWVESIPLLVISGQVKRQDISPLHGTRSLGFQEIKITQIVKPVCKYAMTIINPKEIKYHLEKAVYLAKSGRPGPVWLDIPLDVQASMIDEQKLDGFIPRPPKTNVSKVREQVNELIDLINNAKRPVFLAGYGIKLSNAKDNFYKLINKLGIPVLTTWKVIDLLPENHPLYCGRPGAIGQRGANFVQQNSDLFISIGARLDLGQIAYSYKNFARAAQKIVIDIDQAELDKLKFDRQMRICASAEVFINELLSKMNTVKPNRWRNWLKRCKDWNRRYPVVLNKYRKQKRYVSTYALDDLLADRLTWKDLIVPGSSGACSDIFMQAFKVKRGQRILNTPGLGAMGFGLPASIGACLASGLKRTICINGDGGFQLNIQELVTVSRLKLPIKYFVLNNRGYGSIRTTQRNYFKGFYVASGPESGLVLPPITKVAEAYGIPSVTIKNLSELKKKIDVVLRTKGPVVCDVFIDPDEQVMPKLTSQIKSDGSIVSKPMEDLWPFLDRKEFEANMLIPSIKE
jgi:acetolactate synthase-1/2/3 large subunit